MEASTIEHAGVHDTVPQDIRQQIDSTGARLRTLVIEDDTDLTYLFGDVSLLLVCLYVAGM